MLPIYNSFSLNCTLTNGFQALTNESSQQIKERWYIMNLADSYRTHSHKQVHLDRTFYKWHKYILKNKTMGSPLGARQEECFGSYSVDDSIPIGAWVHVFVAYKTTEKLLIHFSIGRVHHCCGNAWRVEISRRFFLICC